MRRALIAAGLLIFMGCRGKQGEKGPAGSNGSANVIQYQGNITSSGTFKVIVAGSLSSKTVSVYWAPSSSPNNFTELGNPTGTNATTTDPWAYIITVDNSINFVNVTSGDKYRIFVFEPTTTFNNWTAIRSPLLGDDQ
jgi:hypothetical protein